MSSGSYNWGTDRKEEKRDKSSKQLPKFSETFSTGERSNSCFSKGNSWEASTSGCQYHSTSNVLLEKRFDWDGLVDKVFKDEAKKTTDNSGRNKDMY